MQLKFFKVDAAFPDAGEEVLNKFLRGHKVLTVVKELVQGSSVPAYWSIVVEYMETGASNETTQQPGKTDFKDILADEDFALFCRLKDVRKVMAEEASVPVYSIFTNRHLADMAQQRCRDVADIANIHGVGKKRAEKHSVQFLETIKEFGTNASDPADSGDE